MSRYNFKGDVESVRPPQLAFISEVLEKKGFKGPDVIIESVGEAGDNYIANVKRVVITENGTTFKMIAKLAPDMAMMREMGNLATLFRNEHVVYTELLPKFRELQKNANVPQEEWFRFAECYGSNGVVPHEVILLEDLKEDNYVMLDRFKPIANDCVKIVLQKLAIYHSLSYVLKHQDPESFDTLKLKLKSMFVEEMAERDEFKMYFQGLEQGALAVIQDDKYQKLIEGSISQIFQHVIKLEETDVGAKHSVIQQGDGWTNNILFQFEGDTPKNCALIDYQMAKESNPVYDIMYMLFSSTDHQQRQNYYHEFLDYYHSELDRSLHHYGLSADLVFPKEQLDTDMKRYAKLMLGTSIMVSSFVIRKTEDASRVKEVMQNTTSDSMGTAETMSSMLVQDPETILIFKSKIEGLIESFLEFGLLEE